MRECPVCQSQAFSTQGCESCGLRSFKTSPITEYPREASNALYEIEENSFWFKYRADILDGIFKKFEPLQPVMDVGGGNGFECFRLQSKFQQCVLVEPSPDACRNAEKRGVRNILNAKLEDLNLRKSVLGTVCLLDVLEHLNSPLKLLQTVRPLLKDGGRLVVTVPALNLLWSHEDDYAQHQIRFNKGNLKSLITSAGFEIEYCSYFFSPLVLPVLLLRALPSWLGIKRPHDHDLNHHKIGGVFSKTLQILLNFEKYFLKLGFQPPVGTSIVLVARKIKGENYVSAAA